jgi:hypothetical protein
MLCLANIFSFCNHGKRPLLDPVKYCASYLGFGLDFLQNQNSLRSEILDDLNSLDQATCETYQWKARMAGDSVSTVSQSLSDSWMISNLPDLNTSNSRQSLQECEILLPGESLVIRLNVILTVSESS